MTINRGPLVSGEIYHLYNRSINLEPIFEFKRHCQRALISFDYYQYADPIEKLSYFLSRGESKNKELMDKWKKDHKKHVEIIAYCLMPNHYHLLLKQISENGIKDFLSVFQNSYTRYYNTQMERKGPIFQGYFKSVRIETDEQLMHLSRYIHLNPYSSFVVKTVEELEDYPWSSLSNYLTGDDSSFIANDIVLNMFNGRDDYKKFVFDQADYQRELEKVKHLTWD